MGKSVELVPAREIAQTAEEVSDNAAATVCDRVRYAEILLAFMKREAHGPIPAGLPMARYGDPEKRLLRILDQPVISRGLSKRAAAAIIGFSVTATFLIAATKAEFAPRFNEIWQLPAPAVSYPAPPSEVSGHKILVKKAYVPAARPALAQIVAQAPAPATAAPAASPSPSEVRLTLSVTDPAGRYVTGLAAQDFRVTSGQTSPDISSFGLTEAKHCVVLLNTIAEGDDAVNALGGVLDTRDQLAVLAGAPASDPDAFWNAVLGAVNRAKEMSNPYKSVVVMMQGGTLNPMAGEPDLAKIIRAALHSPRVAVSFASIEDIPKPSVGTLSQQDDLRIVAAVTGGQVVPTPSAGEIPSFVTRIAVGLINQYVLGFIPANERAGALARPPTVEVVAHAGLPPLRVIGPGGYYVEP